MLMLHKDVPEPIYWDQGQPRLPDFTGEAKMGRLAKENRNFYGRIYLIVSLKPALRVYTLPTSGSHKPQQYLQTSRP